MGDLSAKETLMYRLSISVFVCLDLPQPKFSFRCASQLAQKNALTQTDLSQNDFIPLTLNSISDRF